MSETTDLRAAADRLEQLLDGLRASLGRESWEVVQEAVGLVSELYGAGLARVLDIVAPEVVDQLAADDLVASLLAIHDLHPPELEASVQAVLNPETGPPCQAGPVGTAGTAGTGAGSGAAPVATPVVLTRKPLRQPVPRPVAAG